MSFPITKARYPVQDCPVCHRRHRKGTIIVRVDGSWVPIKCAKKAGLVPTNLRTRKTTAAPRSYRDPFHGMNRRRPLSTTQKEALRIVLESGGFAYAE